MLSGTVDRDTVSWAPVPQSTDKEFPAARAFHTFSVLPDQNLLLVGGKNINTIFDDCFILHNDFPTSGTL